MAVKHREELKITVLKELPEDRPVKLVDLVLKLKVNPKDLLVGLQSLVANRQLKVARVKKENGEEVWIARNEVPEGNLDSVEEGSWGYQPHLITLKQQLSTKMGDDVRGRVLRLLDDGRPRNLAEIKLELGDEEIPSLGNIAQLIELPGGQYTMRSSTVGEAESERRNREQRMAKERLEQQEKKLRELFKDGNSINKEDLERALGDKLLPQVKSPVLRLINGHYALADSSAAWEDVMHYLNRTGPMTFEDFLRKFKIHSGLVGNLRAGKEISNFVLLPDGRVTSSERPEGKAELARRQIGAGLKEKIKQIYREQPFFNLGQLIDTPDQREVATDIIMGDGAFRININGVGLWTSPYPHPIKIIVQELKRLTGLHLEADQVQDIVPLTWIANHSMNVAEAADRLRLSEEDILNLCELEELSYFKLTGAARLWRHEVHDIKYKPDLNKLVKRATKLTTSEAADLLDTTPERIRRLVREGYVNSAGEIETGSGKMGILVRRGDIQAIKERFPGIEHEWALGAKQQKRESSQTALRKEKPTLGKKRPRRSVTVPPLTTGPVELDNFQENAVKAVLAGKNVLVAAPTGTGKTVIAERLILAVIERGKAAVYTSPLKALSNQKFVDFRNVFGEDMVGLVTGDISINPYAPLLIMTTEIFRNRCFSEPEGLDDVACVVFDEIHYLDDPERGTAWEESIIFAPPHVKFLGLSATVPNIQEIADWMGEVRGEKVEVVIETNRAVPLSINWLTADGTILDEDEAREYIEEAAKRRIQERKAEKQAAREEEFGRKERRWGRGARRSR